MLLIRRRLASLAALTLLILGIALPPAAVAAPPAGWGWVVARHPTTASYVPAALDQGNSSGSSNTVERTSRGHYVVRLPGVVTSDGGGHVQASALSTVPRYCAVLGWETGSDPLDMEISIDCFKLSGVTADTAFSVSFLMKGYNSGLIAYVWANMPTTTDYTPSTFYSTSTINTIHRTSAGHYLVRLPAMDPSHGNVQVTGYDGALCKIGETSSDGSAMIVGVVCPAGDSIFDLLYTKNVGLTGVPRPKAAYLRAFPLASVGHRAPAEFRYSSAGTAPGLSRTGVGTYVVTLPGMAKGGAAHVTAGPGATTCYLTSIRTNATPQKVGVACTNASGTPADAAFDLSYTK